MTAKLKDVIKRAESWPHEAQEELAEIALDIEANLTRAKYQATPEELAGIDRGLREVREGRVVSEATVSAALAKYRRA